MRNTKVITEIAVLVSLAVVLEVVFTGLAAFMPFLALPYGGRVSLSMLPLFVVTYRHGFQRGIMAGMVYGIINLLLDGVLWSPWSLPMDYLFAFGAIGLGYIGVIWFGKNFKGFVAVVLIGALLRYLFHFVSGFWLFGAYMPDTFDNVYVYSLVYNAYYIWPSVVLIILVSAALFKRFNENELF